jgi:alpha-tubulin suppressor-like RCC1 family protein
MKNPTFVLSFLRGKMQSRSLGVDAGGVGVRWLICGLIWCLAVTEMRGAVTTRNYYRMGENDAGSHVGVMNTAQDAVGGKHLNNSGGPFYDSGVSAEAAARVGSTVAMRNFTGTYLTGVTLTNLTDNFGLEAWVKPAVLSGNQCIAYNGNTASSGWGIFLVGSTVQGRFGTTFFGSAAVSLNTWSHVAIVRNAGTATLYVNGVAAGTTTTAPSAPSGNFGVAKSPPAYTAEALADGYVDEVRFFTFAAGQFSTNDLLRNLPEIGVEQPAGTSVTDGGTRAFGTLVVGANASLTFTVTNTGVGLLEGLSITIDGTDAAQFSVTASPATPVAVNGSTTFTVRFTPNSGGSKTAALHLTNNDLDEGVYDITLTGTGVALPEIAIEQPAGTPLVTGTVTAWGWNGWGQTNVPAGLTGVVAVAPGVLHTVALKQDGTVVAWGNFPSYGETNVPPGLAGVKAISAGYSYSVALQSNGTCVAWGYNEWSKTNVPVGLTEVTAISAGRDHVLALKSDGTVTGWGRNDLGQTTAPAGLSGVVAVAAGNGHSVALKSDGTVVAWGGNGSGQTNVPTGLTAQAIAVAADYSAALKSNGTVVVWGNVQGGLLVSNVTGIKAITAGKDFLVAARTDGTVVGWGANSLGQISVPSGLTGVQAIAGRDSHTLALSGSTVQYGRLAVGATGLTKTFTITNSGIGALSVTSVTVTNGNTSDFTISTAGTLASVPAVTGQTTFTVTFAPTAKGTRWTTLRVRNSDTDEGVFDILLTGTGGLVPEIAIEQPAGTPLLTGSIVPWGYNDYGETNTPTGLVGVQAIDAGYKTTMALKADGTVASWGYNAGSQLSLPFGLSEVTAMAAGTSHSAALKSDGTVIAWGSNTSGQTNVPAGLSGVMAIASGQAHMLALQSNGVVVAWGNNQYGQSDVPAGLTGVKAIAANGDFSMAMRSNGTVIAWGRNGSGQTNVPAALSNVQAIAAGWEHGLALKSDGTVTGWGRADNGQITPPAGLSSVVAISAGEYHSLCLKSDGTVVALGTPSQKQSVVPAGLTGVRAVSAGYEYSLTLRDGVVNLGTNLLGITSAAKTFTITNSGIDALAITNITIIGDHASDFTLNTAGMLTTLPALTGQTTFSVTFTPSGTGARQAKVRVVNNDTDEGTYDIVLNGAGVTPEIVVYSGAGTSASDERTDNTGTNRFSATAVGATSLTQTFTVKNTGAGDLLGLAVTTSGANAGDFVASLPGATTLAVNASTTFTVTFAPTAAGTRIGVVNITSNDGDEATFEINVIGEALAPGIAVQHPVGTTLTSGGSKDFGSRAVGASNSVAFTITNTGGAGLVLGGTPTVAVSGVHAAEFTVTAQPATTVAGARVGLTNSGFELATLASGAFSYTPSGSGWTFGSAAGMARNGSPWYVNAAPEGYQAAYIQRGTTSGTNGYMSRVIAFPTAGSYVISFAMVRRSAGNPANNIEVKMDGTTLGTVLNTSQPDDVWRVFTVSYTCTVAGDHELSFHGTRTGGDYASAIDDVQITGPGGVTTFQVAFAPAAAGARAATLAIASNDGSVNPYTLTLTGTGVVPVQPVISASNVVMLGNGTFKFSFTNTDHLSFTVLTATNPAMPVAQWTVLGSPTNTTGNVYEFGDTAPGGPNRYYLLRYP